VFAPTLDAGTLNAKYDVLILPNGAVPGAQGGRGGGGGGGDETIANLPTEYAGQIGRISMDKTVPRIREFIENGGTVLAIGGSAANLASALKLPVENHLVESGTPLPRTKFYVPGSLLSARVDVADVYGQGLNDHADFFFDDSPVFALGATAAPLRSGWAWGQNYLENGAAAVEARIGKGRALLFGPEILQRAQPHGTFKFLFNAIQLGGVTP
jgi:putative intracellular protease/amidase